MSSSRINNTRCRTSVSSSSSSNDDKISKIRSRINQIANTMRGHFQGSSSSSLCETLPMEVKNSKKDQNLGLEAIFKKHGLEDYVFIMKENFVLYEDLKFLTKDDLISMKIPIGPRNRILRLVECLAKSEIADCDRFSNETKQIYKTKPGKQGNREKIVIKNISAALKEISDKQVEMFEMIKENQREIDDINKFSKRFGKY